ncbi:MAG: hypothetical protein RBT36_11750 [Desulfobulbus sp.]|jgi:hypothetical protein|nr:hypothetical protein [Desulfobulbus sp.]
MKVCWLVIWAVVCVSVAACTPHKPAAPAAPTVVLQESTVSVILSCLEENRDLSRQDQRSAYADLEKQANSGADTQTLRLACLGLHERATYRQFRRSIELVTGWTTARPDEATSLNGLLAVLKWLDRERVARWMQHREQAAEKKKLTAENAQLTERIGLFELQAEQDRVRIGELQQQIEQLKNIENIIKTRER